MSQENVEVVRQVCEAFNRRGWDAYFAHPDFEITFGAADSRERPQR